MGQGALMFNLMARRYSRQPIADQASYERKLEITRKYLTPESEVFEFGCGTGSTALLHCVKQAGFSLEEQWNPESSVTVVFLVARKSPAA